MTSHKISLTQASLYLLVQCLNSVGWAKTPAEVYNAGRILSQVIPEVDVTWLKTDDEVRMLTPDARTAYKTQDATFASKVVEFEMTDKDRDLVRKCLEVNGVRLPPNKTSFQLLHVFGFES